MEFEARLCARETASDDVLVLISTIAAWVLIFLGLAFVSSPPILIAGLIIAAMVVARYRDSERRALLWTLAVAAERGVPLASVARAFAAGRIDEIGRRSARLAELLESGVPLPVALDRSQNPLPPDAALAAKLAYATDTLPETLRDAAREGDRLDTISHSYYATLIYFVLMVNLMLAVLGFLVIKVVPTFRQILYDFDSALPPVTAFCFRVAELAVNYGWVLAPLWLLANAALVYAVFGYVGIYLPTWRRWEGWFGRRDTPILLRSLGNSVAHGRPLTESIELLARWYPERSVAARLTKASEQIREGAHWCDSLVQQGLLRPAQAAVLRPAEQIGNLPWAFHELSEMAARRIADRATALSRVLLPVLVLLMALPVGLFAVGFLVPLARVIQDLAL